MVNWVYTRARVTIPIAVYAYIEKSTPECLRTTGAMRKTPVKAMVMVLKITGIDGSI